MRCDGWTPSILFNHHGIVRTRNRRNRRIDMSKFVDEKSIHNPKLSSELEEVSILDEFLNLWDVIITRSYSTYSSAVKKSQITYTNVQAVKDNFLSNIPGVISFLNQSSASAGEYLTPSLNSKVNELLPSIHDNLVSKNHEQLSYKNNIYNNFSNYDRLNVSYNFPNNMTIIPLNDIPSNNHNSTNRNNKLNGIINAGITNNISLNNGNSKQIQIQQGSTSLGFRRRIILGIKGLFPFRILNIFSRNSNEMKSTNTLYNEQLQSKPLNYREKIILRIKRLFKRRILNILSNDPNQRKWSNALQGDISLSGLSVTIPKQRQLFINRRRRGFQNKSIIQKVFSIVSYPLRSIGNRLSNSNNNKIIDIDLELINENEINEKKGILQSIYSWLTTKKLNDYMIIDNKVLYRNNGNYIRDIFDDDEFNKDSPNLFASLSSSSIVQTHSNLNSIPIEIFKRSTQPILNMAARLGYGLQNAVVKETNIIKQGFNTKALTNESIESNLLFLYPAEDIPFLNLGDVAKKAFNISN